VLDRTSRLGARRGHEKRLTLLGHFDNVAARPAKRVGAADWIEEALADQVVVAASRFLPPAVLAADHILRKGPDKFGAGTNRSLTGLDLDPVSFLDGPHGCSPRMEFDQRLWHATAERGQLTLLAVAVENPLR
jgi:hypothetical protein